MDVFTPTSFYKLGRIPGGFRNWSWNICTCCFYWGFNWISGRFIPLLFSSRSDFLKDSWFNLDSGLVCNNVPSSSQAFELFGWFLSSQVIFSKELEWSSCFRSNLIIGPCHSSFGHTIYILGAEELRIPFLAWQCWFHWLLHSSLWFDTLLFSNGISWTPRDSTSIEETRLHNSRQSELASISLQENLGAWHQCILPTWNYNGDFGATKVSP